MREDDDAHARGDLVQMPCDFGGVILPFQDRAPVGMELQRAGHLVPRLRVIVGEDHDILADEEPVVLVAPLAGAAGHGGRGEAERRDPVFASRSPSLT